MTSLSCPFWCTVVLCTFYKHCTAYLWLKKKNLFIHTSPANKLVDPWVVTRKRLRFFGGKNNIEKVFWEFDSIIMQNLSYIFLLKTFVYTHFTDKQSRSSLGSDKNLLVSVVVCGIPIFRIWFYAKKDTVFIFKYPMRFLQFDVRFRFVNHACQPRANIPQHHSHFWN